MENTGDNTPITSAVGIDRAVPDDCGGQSLAEAACQVPDDNYGALSLAAAREAKRQAENNLRLAADGLSKSASDLGPVDRSAIARAAGVDSVSHGRGGGVAGVLEKQRRTSTAEVRELLAAASAAETASTARATIAEAERKRVQRELAATPKYVFAVGEKPLPWTVFDVVKVAFFSALAIAFGVLSFRVASLYVAESGLLSSSWPCAAALFVFVAALEATGTLLNPAQRRRYALCVSAFSAVSLLGWTIAYAMMFGGQTFAPAATIVIEEKSQLLGQVFAGLQLLADAGCTASCLLVVHVIFDQHRVIQSENRIRLALERALLAWTDAAVGEARAAATWAGVSEKLQGLIESRVDEAAQLFEYFTSFAPEPPGRALGAPSLPNTVNNNGHASSDRRGRRSSRIQLESD